MKKNLIIPCILLCGVLFSCSGSDDKASDGSEKVSLMFGAILQDLENKQQQQANSCVGAIPAFAELVVSQDGEMVAGTMEDPLRIKFLQDENGAYYTEESSSLSLNIGKGVLELFSILDKEGKIIWIAPRSDGAGVSEFVENPLPLDIELDVSGPQYVGVEVVCFNDSQSDSYGYSFSADPTRAIEFCIYGSYCDENGRQAEAIQYEVSAWTYSGDPENPKGSNLYSRKLSPLDVMDNEEDTASHRARPLCLPLPDTDREDQYYFEIYFGGLIRTGVITEAQVKDLFVGQDRVDYFHFREGNCNLGDSPDLF